MNAKGTKLALSSGSDTVTTPRKAPQRDVTVSSAIPLLRAAHAETEGAVSGPKGDAATA